MTSVRGRGRPVWRGQASKAPTDWSNNGDHKNSLGSNKPGPSEAPIRSEAPARPPHAPPPAAPDVAQYIQKDMDHLFQTFLQASKGGSGDKLKATIPDVYCGRSHMECYNFCQQCKDHFAICGATRPNWIPFAVSFLRDRINFCW